MNLYNIEAPPWNKNIKKVIGLFFSHNSDFFPHNSESRSCVVDVKLQLTSRIRSHFFSQKLREKD